MKAPDPRIPTLMMMWGSRAVALVFGVILLSFLIHPLYGLIRTPHMVSMLVAAGFVSLVFAAVIKGPALADWLEARPWRRRAALLALLIVTVWCQVRIGMAIRFPPAFDPGPMEDLAEQIGTGGVGSEAADWYLAMYPNNALLLALMTHYFRVLDVFGVYELGPAVVMANAAVLSGALVLTYLTARRMGGALCGYVSVGLAFLFLGISPWMGVLYSDTVGVFFTTAVAYVFVRLVEQQQTRTRLVWWGVVGLLGWVGYQIKPTALFAMIAAVAVGALVRWCRGLTRRAALNGVLALIVLAFGVFGGRLLGGVAVGSADLELPAELRGQSVPIAHFLMMGAQREQPGNFNDYYGCYLHSDVLKTLDTPPDQRTSVAVAEYRRRVANMGPVGYPKFLLQKLTWVFGDGTFFMYGEGGMMLRPQPFENSDPISRALQQWFGLGGDRFVITTTIWQGAWLALVALVALAVALPRKRLLEPGPAQLRLALLLLVVFLALFEGRARYVYLYVPYFAILATLSVQGLCGRRSSTLPKLANDSDRLVDREVGRVSLS